MKKKKMINKNTFYALLMIFPIAALAKFYQYKFTGGNNFGIMGYMLYALYNGSTIELKAYSFPLKIYSLFKFLGFQTNLAWSIFYTVIFNIIIFFLLLKYKHYSLKEYIFIYASMFILSWTVLNMNKDLIQLIFLIIVYIICSSKLSNFWKMLLSASVFAIEALVFREYYVLVAGLLVIVYFILSKTINNTTKKHFLSSMIIIFILFFVGIFCTKFIFPSSYDELVNRREHLGQLDEEVTTIIADVIEGNSYPIFIVNYLINFVRICIPIELIGYGIKYFVFFIYQLMITFSLFKSMKTINKNNLIYVSVILAYTIMMAASESDFGTLTRHQSVLLMFYIGMFKNSDVKEIENEN